MGARRKTKTLTSKGKTPQTRKLNSSSSARNLGKSDLGGVIFGCKHYTYKECISKQLFGLPASHYAYVKNIRPGFTLFLFNYSDRKLHGVFEAVCPGQMNINPYAWTANGTEVTPYPAQVQVKVQKQCLQLNEDQFRPIITDNYYTSKHFWFELDKTQTERLVECFSSQPLLGNSPYTRNSARMKKGFNRLPAPDANQAGNNKEKQVSDADSGLSDQAGRQSNFGDGITYGQPDASEASLGPEAVANPKPEWTYASIISDSLRKKKWSALFKSSSHSDTFDEKEETFWGEDSALRALPHHSNVEWDSCCFEPCLEGGTSEVVIEERNEPSFFAPQQAAGCESIVFEANIPHGDVEWGSCGAEPCLKGANNKVVVQDCDEKVHIDLNIPSSSPSQQAIGCEYIACKANLPHPDGRMDHKINPLEGSIDIGAEENNVNGLKMKKESDLNDDYSEERFSSDSVLGTGSKSCDLPSMVTKLMQEFEDLKGAQMKQILKVTSLEWALANSQEEIQKLKDRVDRSESVSVFSNEHVEGEE